MLESSVLWRKTVKTVAPQYPDVKLDFMYVDNAAMQLVRRPQQFDVMLGAELGVHAARRTALRRRIRDL